MIHSEDSSRIVSLVANLIEEGKLNHPGFYSNSDIAQCLRSTLSRIVDLEYDLGKMRDGFTIAKGVAERRGERVMELERLASRAKDFFKNQVHLPTCDKVRSGGEVKCSCGLIKLHNDLVRGLGAKLEAS